MDGTQLRTTRATDTTSMTKSQSGAEPVGGELDRTTDGVTSVVGGGCEPASESEQRGRV